MPVGELFLSAFLPVLFEKLASRELLNLVTEEGVLSKLKKWERKLKMIQAVLSDAEEKRNIGAVKLWLEDLQDLAYDAEDILDEFATETLRRISIAENHDEASFSEARKLIPSSFKNYTPRAIKFDFSMRSKIKDITIRLEELCKERVELGLLVTSGGTSGTEQILERRPPSSSVSTEPEVFGRKEDIAKILEMVIRDEPTHANVSVIAIVGMGGIGKTTLAREIYNDKKAASKFEKTGWVCVSDDFDVLKISKALLESIDSESPIPNNLNELQVKLTNAIKGKRFFLVLDDVWNENNHLWETLKSPLMAGARGSKMIVTTRSERVALTVTTFSNMCNLNRISDGDCLRLFKKHAFDEVEKDNADRIPNPIYKRVVEKCGGLPLAAKTLGGILRSKQIEEWENVLSCKIWDSPKASGILPVLMLSYQHLPSHLKRCFAHCAIFPKDYEFEEKELVLLWIAEGIIQQSENNTQLDLAGQYFRHLLSISLFQQSNKSSSKYIMHDLIHDLAESVFGEIGLRLEKGNKISKSLERVRHFSYIFDYYEGKNKFKDLQKLESLRTFLPVFMSPGKGGYITAMVLFDLLPKFKMLRVLSLERYNITQIPDLIGDLIHLRYLNFAYTKIKSLPESISSLSNLQTLILKDCSLLEQLPSKMRYLTNLCYLDIKGANSLKEMPPRMKDLKNLRILSNFIVGKGTSSNLKDLKNLHFLRGELHISKLDNVIDSKNIGESILSDKKDLEVLLLEWVSKSDNPRNENVEKKVLEMLKPHKNLEELTIKQYGGSKFSSWLGDSSLLSKVVVLKLENCEKCIILPSLGGLSSLKNLTIIGMMKLKRLDSQNIPFKSLETLYFENLQELEHWDPNSENEGAEGFSHLHELSIVKCPKLIEKLPDNLPQLEKLVIKECAELIVPLSSFPTMCNLEIRKCKGVVYSSTNSTNFHSLNFVALSNIPKCGNWINQGFHKILTIVDCEKLMSLWKNFTCVEKPLRGMHNHTSLKKLSIYNCASLGFFAEISFLPNLSSLEIYKCEALQSLPEGFKQSKLESLEIRLCHSLLFIARGTLPPSLKSVDVQICKKLQCLVDDSDYSCASSSSSSLLTLKESFSTCLLEDLSISECPSITCISSKGELPMTLKKLTICQCLEFTTLSTSKLPKALEILNFTGCPKTESIAETFDNCLCLREIEFDSCDKLKYIPLDLHNLSCLWNITINRCPSLISLPGGLPNTILRVSISDCENFEGLAVDHLQSLDSLFLSSCPKFKTPLKLPNSLSSLGIYNSLSFAAENLPADLINLTIEGDVKFCKPLIELGLNNLTFLTELIIDKCEDAEQIFQEDNGMPTSLIELSIWNSPKLEYLSSTGFQNLICLQSLKIYGCRKLISISDLDNLISLQSLNIKNCRELKSISDLDNLISLQSLNIMNCPALKSIPNLGNLISLQSLEIAGCAALESIPDLGNLISLESLDMDCIAFKSIPDLGSLISLQSLDIADGPALESIPDLGSLISLESLSISECPKLKSFPSLPSSLLRLAFTFCPKLKRQCKRGKGKYWRKIKDIPEVFIDNKFIYDL